MTMTDLLTNAQSALGLVKAIPISDPRVTLAMDLLSGTLEVIQGLHRQGMFDPSVPIEVDAIGMALTKNIQAQLQALGMDTP